MSISRSQLLARLRRYGFASVTEFMDRSPTASLESLASELGNDIATEQVAQMWWEEAELLGGSAIEHLARRSLVGALHRGLPEGWPVGWTGDVGMQTMAAELSMATTQWAHQISVPYKSAAYRVLNAMLDAGRAGVIPPRWLPATVNDPLLAVWFRQHWRPK